MYYPRSDHLFTDSTKPVGHENDDYEIEEAPQRDHMLQKIESLQDKRLDFGKYRNEEQIGILLWPFW